MTRVLLVEDSADVLEVLQIELELVGYDVEAVLNAEAAIIAAQHCRPDIIISDLGLPGIDGFEFIKCVRKTPDLSAVPAIALTGASMERDIQQAIAFGFTAHLTKPVDGGELVTKIEQLTAPRFQRKTG